MQYAILLISLTLPFSEASLERSPDWDKYEVYGKQKGVSYAVSVCMARKTLKVEDGAGYSYAEPFYRLCMAKHSSITQKYSSHFKSQTIGRFHYILKRTDKAIRANKP